MRKELKRELSFSVQYFVMVLVALVVAFFGMLPGSGSGEFADAINLNEAWKNVDPYVKSVLLIFSALCVVRLLAVSLVSAAKKPLG